MPPHRFDAIARSVSARRLSRRPRRRPRGARPRDGATYTCDRRCYADYEACAKLYGLTLLDAVQGTRPEARLCEATEGSCLTFCAVSTDGLQH